MELDEASAPPLSRLNNDYIGSNPKPTKGKRQQLTHDDLDLEISASMAKLLSKNLQVPGSLNSDGSFESEKLLGSSPVFTTLEAKDQDLVLSFGLVSSANVLLNGTTVSKKAYDLDYTTTYDLEPILERSIELTPEPHRPRRLKKTSSGSVPVKKVTSASTSASASPPIVPKHSDDELDTIIDSLIEVGSRRTYPSKKMKDKLPLSTQQIKYILAKSRQIFLEQPTLLRLSPPVKVVGDIHGQFHDLIRIFNSCGYPPHTNYLFLGDYVDRGHKSLETILLLLCFKIKYPENFFMLRGNHESANITKIYGFYDECKRRLPLISGSHKLWKSFVDVFNTLPIAATINDKIFCIHGGLSPDLDNLKQIENIRRPTDIPDKGLLADLLWSDPDPLIKNFSLTNWPKNDRGVSYTFGKKHVDHFLARFNMDLIVRGHMVVEDGYEFFNRRKFVTIFSAPNYCGEFNNYGAIMSVDQSLCCSFELLKPQ